MPLKCHTSLSASAVRVCSSPRVPGRNASAAPCIVPSPTSSPASGGDPTPIDNEGSGLASTGFAGGPLVYVAGGLVLAGAVVLVVALIRRRKRA